MRARFTGAVALLAAGTLLAGCYHYVPCGNAQVPRATPVRVHLAPPRSFELPSVTVHNVSTINAEMVREENVDLVLSAKWLDTMTGGGFDGENWTLRVPRSAIGNMEIRRLSVWRTAGVLAGGILATYLGFHGVGGSDAGGGTSGGGTNPR